MPDNFDPAKALVADGRFLLTDDKSYIACKPMEFLVDKDHFKALDFPFFTDGKNVFTSSGERIKDADVASFVTLTDNQAKDKNHYYFIEGESVTLPYKKSVSAFPPCFGWVNIDGEMYFRGKKQTDIDIASFSCLTFSVSVDKYGFYVYNRRKISLPEDTDSKKIHLVVNSGPFFTDGKYVWFIGVDGVLLTDLHPANISTKRNRDKTIITDGYTSWQCGDMKSSAEPQCQRQPDN